MPARSAGAPALGLSKDHISPLSYEKGVDAVDIADAIWAARRRYKTGWERAKRKRLREIFR
jgi:hypothetical protein